MSKNKKKIEISEGKLDIVNGGESLLLATDYNHSFSNNSVDRINNLIANGKAKVIRGSDGNYELEIDMDDN